MAPANSFVPRRVLIDSKDEKWKKKLSPEEFRVLRQKGTELPYSGQYNDFFEEGTWHCKACDEELFDGSTKFETHCGWPGFYQARKNAIDESEDLSHGMTRTEVTCHGCNSHLGHVFNDGPPPTGLRYCINSICLVFKPK